MELTLFLFMVGGMIFGFAIGHISGRARAYKKIPHNDKRTMNLVMLSIVRAGVDYDDAKRVINRFENNGIIFLSKRRW